MDEPLGALDKQLREHMQIELKELHRQLGVTFVYVTHDQSEALTMSDRVAVFDDGAIQQIDAVDRLYETRRTASWPASSATARCWRHGARQRRRDALRHRAHRRPGADRRQRQRRGGRRRGAGRHPARAHRACTRRRRRSAATCCRHAVARTSSTSATTCGCCAHVGEGQADATVKLPLSVPRAGRRRAGLARVPAQLTRIYA